MIRSTFSGFNMAQLALMSNQRAIDIAGHNISNINTYGFTRQRLDLASINPVGASYSSSPFDMKVGQGVMMTGISQIRDPFLDIQFRNQIAKVGTADATDKILEQIGNIFDETDSSGIKDALGEVLKQLKEMANPENAGEQSVEALLKSNMQVLMNLINQKAEDINGLKEELISQLQDSDLKNLNSCIERIVELNESIKNAQVLGSPALELQDQRNALLDDLATYLPINVKYRTDTSTGVPLDVLEVTFRDGSGEEHLLISDNEMGEFTLDDNDGKIPVSLSFKGSDGEAKDITDLLRNGVLKGNLDMLNQAGAFDGSGVKGVGYYEKMFDSFVNQLATTMNELNAIKNPDGSVTNKDLFVKKDGADTFTAENIQLSEAWMNGEIGITLCQPDENGNVEGSSAYENVLKMFNALSSDKHQFVNADGNVVFEGTIEGGYDHLANTQAIDRKATQAILTNHLTVLGQIENSKDAVSGVSMDEEVMDLMRYQQSYNAASRLMTTLDQILDKLINETGVVGR
ncbi:flagellar hook-associated protein FlgK [Ohessyouella blattaphilus]|uniref:Flagellar hook-associated protein 1 n=1 Tax=Ohessyouella blattaphilus TaxID=2949333 RepID=A0ABT1EEM3_9FIRM|nr:flagellar hook-associated protein FlgK [Ohessyouella blattaphilus]MCP1109154.1 flagellar hook-associated protein FlgK [Ohessyouella blattaphilus]MCR8562548.1 flagellar hook-associated protein FlgK [Ohessyouella blattaphilus]